MMMLRQCSVHRWMLLRDDHVGKWRCQETGRSRRLCGLCNPLQAGSSGGHSAAFLLGKALWRAAGS